MGAEQAMDPLGHIPVCHRGAYTAPTAIYMNGGSILKEYGPYNGSRLPDFNSWTCPPRGGLCGAVPKETA